LDTRTRLFLCDYAMFTEDAGLLYLYPIASVCCGVDVDVEVWVGIGGSRIVLYVFKGYRTRQSAGASGSVAFALDDSIALRCVAFVS